MAVHVGSEGLRAQEYQRPHGAGKTLLRMMFSHVGLFILVCLYAGLGAKVLMQIELGEEEMRYQIKKNRGQDIEDAVNYLSELCYYYHTQNLTLSQWKKKVPTNLKQLVHFTIEATKSGYDGKINGWVYDWTFGKSLLYTISIITTIGYGHITPKTDTGRIATIIYAVVGIPLLLIFLANIGDSMANTVKYMYSRWCCRWCRSRRKKSESPNGIVQKGERLIDEEVGEEPYMPTNSINVPILVNLCIITLYLIIGALLFEVWEGWTFTTSIYFTFITLSTIGFGDFVPGKSFVVDKEDFGQQLKMFGTVLYCIMGMALVSMCINLMQEQIVEKVRWVAREVGLTQDPRMAKLPPIDVLRHRHQLLEAKKRKLGIQIMETPCERSGNRPTTGKNKRYRGKPLPETEKKSARPQSAISVSGILD